MITLLSMLILSQTPAKPPGDAPVVLTSEQLAWVQSLPEIAADLQTEPVGSDADDPAVWVNRRNPEHSLLIGTDKQKAPLGGLVFFNLQGKIVHRINGLNRPNNVDVLQSDVSAPTEATGLLNDLVITTERLNHRLLIHRVHEFDGNKLVINDITGNTTLLDASGKKAEPMGITTLGDSKSASAFVSFKASVDQQAVSQYELLAANDRIDLKLTQRLGKFSGRKEIESLATFTQPRQVAYSDELFGVRVVSLTDPKREMIYSPAQAADASTHTGTNVNLPHLGDHEGLAFFTHAGSTFLLSTDQLPGQSVFRVFKIGEPSPRAIFRASVDETDGVTISQQLRTKRFPAGIFVAMNSKGKNFKVFDLQKILHLL